MVADNHPTCEFGTSDAFYESSWQQTQSINTYGPKTGKPKLKFFFKNPLKKYGSKYITNLFFTFCLSNCFHLYY